MSSGSQVLHTGGQVNRQTDMIKHIVAFRNFANAPKNLKVIFHITVCILLHSWST